jgi:hypothetical protein
VCSATCLARAERNVLATAGKRARAEDTEDTAESIVFEESGE